MDFTLTTYQSLLFALKNKNYAFVNHSNFGKKPSVLLRHDVDRLPKNALKMAQLEKSLGIQSIYYFRMVSHVFKPEVISKIAELGHEIGYHYEDVDLASKSIKTQDTRNSPAGRAGKTEKEIVEKGIELFVKHLNELRQYCPVNTICMHGSPLSKYDNRLLWKHYNYRDFDVEFEPYFDVDYNVVFYITDTGRQWNNENISVRDKVDSGFDIQVKSTQHLIQLAEAGELPDKIMINTHPHRWFNPGLRWVKELVMQNIKNVVKYYLIKRRK